MKLLVINGPNINLLGIREPGIYGTENYETLCGMIREYCVRNALEVEIWQSNHEGAIVDKIQEAFGRIDGIIINPGAYTHTSIAILDALKGVGIPTVEVHISDVSKRESFRQISYVRMAAVHTVMGEGLKGYLSAIRFLQDYLDEEAAGSWRRQDPQED